jgi:ubiquinone/menaquinone biosynthesis C-methylase UbiE
MNFSKVIDLEDFSSEKLKPYLLKIAEMEMGEFGIKTPTVVPDSKNWETAMALYSFEQHGVLEEGRTFAGIGAGTERLTELLANTGAIVFPVDRYLETTPWSDVAPSGYMVDASEYTSKCTQTRNIIPVHSDARELALPSKYFDAVYSSGSIEHFGGLDAVEAAAAEIGRILKPGGVASISTEFWLEGPTHKPWFDDNCILFTPELIKKHIIEPSGLIPQGMPTNKPSAKTYETRKNLINFLNSAKRIKTFEDKLDVYPNLVLFHEGFLFCSVHILLKKPHDWMPQTSLKNSRFHKEIKENNKSAIKVLKYGSKKEKSSSSFRNGLNLGKRILLKVYGIVRKNPALKYYAVKFLIKFPKLSRYLQDKCKN